MSRKRFTAVRAAASMLAGCTSPPATPSAPITTRPSAQLGTVDPAYPVGDELAPPDIEVLEAIPVAELVTDEPIPSTPRNHATACRPMAEEVEEHLAMANGGTTDQLAHLVWLRIDGHYAIERILEFDRTKSCSLSLDVSSTYTIHAVVYRIDPATGEPANSDTNTSVRKLCPVTRKIAKNLLTHLDDQQPSWWETAFPPTE